MTVHTPIGKITCSEKTLNNLATILILSKLHNEDKSSQVVEDISKILNSIFTAQSVKELDNDKFIEVEDLDEGTSKIFTYMTFMDNLKDLESKGHYLNIKHFIEN